jgi:predicted porin
MAFYGQVIIGRKFSERFTLQLMPTLLHVNLVEKAIDNNDTYSLGVGARIKLSNRMSVNADYYYRLNPNQKTTTHAPLSLGLDIETGGHVFQLHFTNSKGMNERAFLSDNEYSWSKGDIMFGFNISRSFQIKKKKG